MTTTAPPHRLWDLVLWRAERTPGRILLSDDRGAAMTAAGLRDAAERVGAGLAALGVREGSRVMWQLPTTLECVVLSVALARLGAVQNPVITVLREAELRALDEQFAPEFAVVPTRWRGFEHAAAVRSVAGSRARVIPCDHNESTELALPQGDPADLPSPPASDAPRWVYVTSGSTARPKGVLHTDASVFASSNAMVDQFGAGEDDVFPMAYPFAHIGGMAWLVTTLRVGSRLVLLDNFDPARTPVTMAEHGATILGSATPFFQAYLAAQRKHGAERLFPGLRLCMGGGAAVSPDLDEIVRRTLGGDGVVNGYGLTEFPIAGFPRRTDAAGKARSSWLPGPGVEVRIAGADGRDLPAGSSGELRLRGPQRFAGYLDHELDATAIDEQGYVRTGDLAVVDEHGLVTITGRLKEIVVRGGENISVAEIEAVLSTHPAIADIAVIGLPDPRLGETCCAVVVPADGLPPPTLDDVRAHCRDAGMARYKTPERVRTLASIPRNSMGKIQRQQVRAAIADGDTVPDGRR
ncbi:AMP-binding protein [Amycolatopsis acidiphila]|uniref:class I adenylate-forming enzyme family protein n=1 Tax=Amycolatopsis acidiphila TaxID=715473 RepID=UPI0019C31078|nr:AMP-binding protein [Amycolatopsis acidiphila]UIJ57204.1 AMP-binding protein [Amycolatopsis acidiphila]GHG52696.1 cyclohexanecarboxylate-CoA ligase [Amycolatopsis acidiphila]